MHTCRTNAVAPGGTCYLWFPRGGVSRPEVPAGWTVHQPAHYSIGEWHWQWAWAIRVPSSAKPGKYQVAGVDIVVVKPAVRPLKRIAVSNSLSDCQKWLDKGYDLELSAGIHRWSKALRVPDGATISSAGAWCVRSANGDYEERMFVPAGSMTLDGLVLTHDESIDWPVYIHAYPEPPGCITIRNCVIRRGELLRCYSPNAIVERCRFERAGTGQVPPSSVWNECEFIGHAGRGRHAWFNTGSVGGLVVNCSWQGTTRGMVFQTGPAAGWLTMSCQFSGISGGEDNASEVILLEAGTDGQTPPGDGICDNTWLDCWISDSSGPAISLYGSGMSGNVFRSIDCGVDATGVSVVAMRGGEHGENEFHNIESTGGLDFRGRVGDVTLGNVQLLDVPQRRGNQGPYSENLTRRVAHWPVYCDADAKQHGRFRLYGCGLMRRGKYEPMERVA